MGQSNGKQPAGCLPLVPSAPGMRGQRISSPQKTDPPQKTLRGGSSFKLPASHFVIRMAYRQFGKLSHRNGIELPILGIPAQDLWRQAWMSPIWRAQRISFCEALMP